MHPSAGILFCQSSCTLLLLLTVVALYAAVVTAPPPPKNGDGGVSGTKTPRRSASPTSSPKRARGEATNVPHPTAAAPIPSPRAEEMSVSSATPGPEATPLTKRDIGNVKRKFEASELPQVADLDSAIKSGRPNRASGSTGAAANELAYSTGLRRVDHYSVWGYEWLHCVADRFGGEIATGNLVLGTKFANMHMSALEGALAKARERCAAGGTKTGWSLQCHPTRISDQPWTATDISWMVFNEPLNAADRKVEHCYKANIIPLSMDKDVKTEDTYGNDIFEACCKPSPHPTAPAAAGMTALAPATMMVTDEDEGEQEDEAGGGL